MLLKNGTMHCSESAHIAPYRTDIVFVNTKGRKIKATIPSEEVTLLVEVEGREIRTEKPTMLVFLNLWEFAWNATRAFCN